MRLRAWRDTWMWLAVSACGAPQWMTKSGNPKVSIFDAPPLAGATYFATIDAGDFGNPGPRIAMQHGSFECDRLVELLGHDGYGQSEEQRNNQLAIAMQTCDLALGKLLRENAGFVLVVDGQGPRWLSAQEVLAAAAPIDTPAKALLAVWVSGKYEPTWGDGKTYYGGLQDGLVRKVDGGFEVAGSTSVTDSDCSSLDARETVVNYRHTIFVDAKGTVSSREKVESSRDEVSDPCHPHGRRPECFADIASGGTVHGYFVRALHHEAESVRAFERIARELRAYGAPVELCEAAEQAALDERDHAARCARISGVPLVIARDELPVRSLIDFAIDNTREGCVGEAYAALAAVVQAQAATDPILREHFAAIATDELAHAALAHAIANWLAPKLTAGEQRRVRGARDAAVLDLAASLDVAMPRELGLPTGTVAVRLLEAVAGLG